MNKCKSVFRESISIENSQEANKIDNKSVTSDLDNLSLPISLEECVDDDQQIIMDSLDKTEFRSERRNKTSEEIKIEEAVITYDNLVKGTPVEPTSQKSLNTLCNILNELSCINSQTYSETMISFFSDMKSVNK